MHDFENAAATYVRVPAYNMATWSQAFLNCVLPPARRYEQLSKNHPEVAEYKAYYAQSLYKAGLYEASAKAAVQIEAPEYAEQVCRIF